MNFPGEVVAEIVEARFAFAGNVVYVGKKIGEKVRQGEIISSLDRKVLQTELDQQLADYEKVRAQFEISRIKLQGTDDTTKFLAQISQSELNNSVKSVELAKHRLDQADLISPVNGTILDMGTLVVRLNITPASNPVKILDNESLRLTFEISQDLLGKFLSPTKVTASFRGVKTPYEGVTEVPNMGNKGKFKINVKLVSTPDLIPGMMGEIKFKK